MFMYTVLFFNAGHRDLHAKNLGSVNKVFMQGVSAKTFEPNISVIFQRIFVKFKMLFHCSAKESRLQELYEFPESTPTSCLQLLST
jgi:hypothetical protein